MPSVLRDLETEKIDVGLRGINEYQILAITSSLLVSKCCFFGIWVLEQRIQMSLKGITEASGGMSVIEFVI